MLPWLYSLAWLWAAWCTAAPLGRRLVQRASDFPLLQRALPRRSKGGVRYRFQLWRNPCVTSWTWWNDTATPNHAMHSYGRAHATPLRYVAGNTLLFRFYPFGDVNLGHFWWSFGQFVIGLQQFKANLTRLLFVVGHRHAGLNCSGARHTHFEFPNGTVYAPTTPDHYLLAQLRFLLELHPNLQFVINHVGCEGWWPGLCFETLWSPRPAAHSGLRMYDHAVEGVNNTGPKAMRQYRSAVLAAIGATSRRANSFTGAQAAVHHPLNSSPAPTVPLRSAHVCVYLRQHQRRRPCTNTAALLQAIQQVQQRFGFSVEVLDDWLDQGAPPYEEQVQKFHTCDVFLSNHGTVLWNVLWMPSGGVVMQLPGCVPWPYLAPFSSHLGVVAQLHWLIGTRTPDCSAATPLRIPWAAVLGDLGPLFAIAQRRLEGPLPDDSVAAVFFERKRDREWRGRKGPWGTCDCLMCSVRDCSMYPTDIIRSLRLTIEHQNGRDAP
eukprot:GGOE01003772.1.p1 GENE.GGOE01003772.1~~GGOE01003772.1.p1  ORF type:complete len:491 (-),score=73.15 GGOE01003772.1:547-2019(-)